MMKTKLVVLKRIILKVNHILFWWYYKRVPEFFHQWTLLKSINLLKQNYEHSLFREKGLEEVIKNASKREQEMRTQISNLELKLKGIPQESIDALNKMFGTSLKGVSKQERSN